MSHASSLFADRIVNVAVTGPLIRLEFGTMQPPKAEGEKPQLLASNMVVMPLDGFLASFGMLEAVIKQLIASGAIKQQAPAVSAETLAAAPVSSV